MPPQKSSKELTWAVLLWLFIGACVWTGCGPGRTMQLVNGYECHIDKAFISISFPDTNAMSGNAVSDAGEFGQVGDVLFGSRVEWNSDVVIGYFIIDTLTHEVQLIESWHDWIEKLDSMGIAERNVRWPGVFFHGVPNRALAIGIGGLFIILALLFFGVRGLARYELELRQRKIDRR